MLDILRDYLESNAPHMTSSVKDAMNAFEKADLPNYEDGFVNILMTTEHVDITSPADQIMAHVLELQNYILNQHEVKLIDTATIGTHTLFINGLLDIESYGDAALMYKTASLNNYPNEIFAEVIALVSHKNSDELLPEIDNVGIALIGRIKDMCEEVPEPITEAEMFVRQKYIDILNKFISVIATTDLRIVDAVKAGVDPGYSFETYLGFIKTELENYPAQQAAYELIAAALISEDGHDNPVGIIQKYIDNYITDIDKITRISVIATEMLLKLQLI